MSVDNIGLFILTAAAVAYMYDTGAPKVQSLPSTLPSQEREIDLTRWRHDGTQPTKWHNGNGFTVADPVSAHLQNMLS